MVKKGKGKRFLALGLTTALVLTSAVVSDVKAEAASAKKVKSVTLKINKTKVNKKTVKLAKGNKAKIKVTVNPKKAKKSVSFKSSKPKVASVSKKGSVTAKKNGTAKITVTVKGKNGKKKKAWVKIKVGAAIVPSTDPTAAPSTKPSATPDDTTIKTVETTIPKTEVSNPLRGTDGNGELLYGGDPAVLVDGDTVYLYTGHDTSTTEGYFMPEWQCFSTKDLKNWDYEGVIMKGDKASITWANTGTDAWAGQIEKYNGKYYFYYCTWDKDANGKLANGETANGQQSIGVAVSDSPTGPFIDKGEPLVRGTVTTGATSGWNDIDPTVWVETDDQGVEHRYLAWGNGKVFVCELNEDMISVKDLNGDGEITFGTQVSGKTSADVDIIEKNTANLTFTEAPWIYRRKDADGKVYGQYYLFYAWGWREEMAYATTDDLLNGTLKFGSVVMPPTATSNTNHMAVFDWKGKTYFIYHNGSLPGGSGFRRTPCIAELHFNEDGSIQPIPETAIGITGATPYTIYTSNGEFVSHENFRNSSADASYPYTAITVGAYADAQKEDTEWAIVAGKGIPTGANKDAYVSIQSENKPGLYLTANEDSTVTLAQDAKYGIKNGKIVADANTAKAQTFHTVKGLSDANGISFESVAKPGQFITLSGGSLILSNGSNKAAATFYLNEKPASASAGTGTDTTISSMKADNQALALSGDKYSLTVPYGTKLVKISFSLKDTKAYAIANGLRTFSTDTLYISLSQKNTSVPFIVYASNGTTNKTYTIDITIANPTGTVKVTNEGLFKTFTFEDQTDDAVAVNASEKPVVVSNPSYEYVEGINGKAISLSQYGLKLCDSADIGSTYSISYWIKPNEIGGINSPTLAGGTFSPQYWFNLSFGRGIWSNNGGYVDTGEIWPYKANEWQHVTLTVDGAKAGTATNTSSAKLYVNGELVVEGNIAADVLSQSGAAIYFGANGWPADGYVNGALDEVAIFKRVLSDEEVLSIAVQATDVNTIKNTPAS